jgi:hypothetical protein
MAKSKRTVVGSVCKSKDAGKPDYLVLRGNTAEELARALMKADKTKGISLKLESKKFQMDSLDQAVSSGKLSGDLAEKIKADRISKIPDWVRFEVVLVESGGS